MLTTLLFFSSRFEEITECLDDGLPEPIPGSSYSIADTLIEQDTVLEIWPELHKPPDLFKHIADSGHWSEVDSDDVILPPWMKLICVSQKQGL